METLQENGFTFLTEEQVVSLIRNNEHFLNEFAQDLSPQLFREAFRPTVKATLKYWQLHRKLIPFEILQQELVFEMGCGMSDTLREATFRLLERDSKLGAEVTEYVSDHIRKFIHFKRVENNVVETLKLIDAADSKNDFAKFNEAVELLKKTVSEPAPSEMAEFRSYTPGEIKDIVGATIPYLVKPYVPRGIVIDLFSKIKCGKTILSMNIAASLCEGGTFLGEQAEKTPVVYLTEQNPYSFATEMDVVWPQAKPDNLHVMFIHDSRKARLSWPQVVDKAVIECDKLSASIVIIDTFSTWAKFEEGGENDSAAGDAAMAELSKLTSKGITVLIDRHGRKSGGEISDAARGTSAIGGGADILLHLKHPEGNPKGSNKRILDAVGRYPLPSEPIEIELGTNGRYSCNGTARGEKEKSNQDLVLSVLTSEYMSRKQVADLAGLTPAQTHKALMELERDTLIERTGVGTKGAEFKYRRS